MDEELDLKMNYDELNKLNQDGMDLEENFESANYICPDLNVLNDNYITPEQVLTMQNINGKFFFDVDSEFSTDYTKLEDIYSENYKENSKIYSDEYLSKLDNKFSAKGIKGGKFGNLFKSQLKVSKSNGPFNNVNNVNSTPQSIPTPSYVSSHN
jgi:vacuolar-type H+-ATPase subunit I/STV1